MRANQKRLIISVIVLILALLPLLIPHGGAEGGTFLSKIAANIRLGLDIKGGALLEYQMVTQAPKEELVTAKIEYGQDIPPVRVRVEIPGITDIEKAERLIGSTGKLYFADVLDIETGEATPQIPSDLLFEVSKRKLQGAEPYWLRDIHFGKLENGVRNQTWFLISPKVLVGTQFMELNGSSVTDAQPGVNPKPRPGQGKFMVTLKFNSEGANAFYKITAEKASYTSGDVKNRLAIVLDDRVIIAPGVDEPISGGSAVITGLQTIDEAKEVAILVGSGNLPVELASFNKQILSPTLGRDIIMAALWAGIAGLIVVMIYMVIFYGIMGLVADIALVYNGLLLFGLLSATGSILTLPGIAGIILTIGTTVDGNLYFGTGTVKGFAITLILGVIGAMFTNLVVSRTMLTGMSGSIKPARYVKETRTGGGEAR